MGKVIYQPKGKAREYSPWACNLYNGCTNRCDYCYNRHCQAKALLGKDDVTLKESLGDRAQAYAIFCKELEKYRFDIISADKGLFFNFVSDPCLPETIELNMDCISYAVTRGVKCVILTKKADWVSKIDFGLAPSVHKILFENRGKISVGFTLTGCDEQEPGASTNLERINAMRLLQTSGFGTWASIEPVIDVDKSFDMIVKSWNFCDHYKIGLLSGKRNYDKEDVVGLIDGVANLNIDEDFPKPIYWKDSVRDFVGPEYL